MRSLRLLISIVPSLGFATAILVSQAAADDAAICTKAIGEESIAACTHFIQNREITAQDRSVGY